MNSSSFELVLYGTDHCALCESALELLISMPELSGGSVRVVDVAGDEALTERYGFRLPVLAIGRPDREPVELDWPFDATAVRGVLS